MHTRAFSADEKKRLQEIAQTDANVAIAITHLSQKAKTKAEKRIRLLAKDVCIAALKSA